MTRMLRGGLLAGCWVLVSLVMAPAVAAPVAPESIARAYFAALNERGMGSIAEFMHPDELLRFKEMLLPLYEAEAEQGGGDLRKQTFGDKATLADVKNASPAAFMRRFLAPMAEQMKAGGVIFDRVDVLGAVREGEVAHVVARIHIGVGDAAMSQMDVISMKPMDGGSWGIMLTGQMEGMARALRGAALADHAGQEPAAPN